MNERFARYLEALDPNVPAHRVEFSRRITESWALIYYRRHLVRLSPYLFLLEPAALRHGSHWRELDATLRHEAAHAFAYHHRGDTGHSTFFHAALERLGVLANGSCDLGPENAAYRYVYACPGCEGMWHRRAPLKGNWSCGACAPGRFDPTFRLVLREQRDLLRALDGRREAILAALTEGMALRERDESALACAASLSSATPPPALQASPTRT
ncbi:MAG TPA: SprT-like domain-containing protein [Candidatus Thermoplasmatota archaeon]|nr:SprT-like domain-containing protein [Candidatus Thermoplasmatota archaeon]